MTPAQIVAAHRRSLALNHETVTVRRLGSPNIDATVFANVVGGTPSDVVGMTQQKFRTAIILTDDLVSASFPLPILEKVDRLVWDGKTLVITAVRPRRAGGRTVAYEIDVAGA
jgi:hypothetical protein